MSARLEILRKAATKGKKEGKINEFSARKEIRHRRRDGVRKYLAPV